MGAFSYPDQITLSPAAEAYLHRLADDLAAGVVEFRQLPPALRALHVFAYEQGRASAAAELERLSAEADRLYAEIVRRPPSRDTDSLNASLEAIKHRGTQAAEQRAAEIRAYIGSDPTD
ncbi:MAG: hypothetical protein V4755_17350, partial [Curtobacterium sp.]